MKTGNPWIDEAVSAGRVTLDVGPKAPAGSPVMPGREVRTSPQAVGGESEASFQRRVIALAQANGWKVAHFRRARTKTGWATPVAADGAGFPDLIMARDSVVLVAELKTDTGRARPDQLAWLAAFRAAGIAASIWRPKMMPVIIKALT